MLDIEARMPINAANFMLNAYGRKLLKTNYRSSYRKSITKQSAAI